jgi:hypothetical protein
VAAGNHHTDKATPGALSQFAFGTLIGTGTLFPITGSGIAQAPMAEDRSENQGADASCHCYSNPYRRHALSAAPRLS